MYTEKELVKIAKRENNNKRKYLVVNPLQAKHIPVKPSKTIKLFNSLADIIKSNYKDEKLLLVGFAETATAIGAGVSINLNSYYMQTTREIVDDCEYLFFTESHSHATEQKLVKNDIDSVINKVDRIVFIEDEVTTGNTIMKIVNIIKKLYGNNIKFAVASLLNGMNKENLEDYKNNNIDINYLVKTDHSTFTEIAEQYIADGEYIIANKSNSALDIKFHNFKGLKNTRRLTTAEEYVVSLENLWQSIYGNINFQKCEDILVIGTEEFMYPAIFIANKLEQCGKNVLCHSTTRSPIEVSKNRDYPLHKRYSLLSFYDKERNIYIYDLKKYDKVVIITDAECKEKDGINTLINALKKAENKSIEIVRWY